MSYNILLIEDDIYISDIYKRQLDLAGMQTSVFYNAKDGLKALTQKKYDIILLDIMLPDINGLFALRTIKQDPLTKDIPVILLTNITQDSTIKAGMNEGAAAYLLKATITPKQLLSEIERILNKPNIQ